MKEFLPFGRRPHSNFKQLENNTHSEEENPLCRICQDESILESLIAPCECSGSIKFVHRKCLLSWLDFTMKQNTLEQKAKIPICTICGNSFKFKWYKPHFGAYLIDKLLSLNLNTIFYKFENIFSHLFNFNCNHIFLCWTFRALVIIFFAHLTLLIGRFEMWLLSSGTSWLQFVESLEGTFNNIFAILIAFGFHAAIFFLLFNYFQIAHNPYYIRNPRVARAKLEEIKSTAALIIVVGFCLIVPAIHIRLLLWIFFGIDWTHYEIDLGTGKNIGVNFIFSLIGMFLSSLFASSVKFLYQDFTIYQRLNSKPILL